MAELGHMRLRVNFQGVPQITQLQVISQMCFSNNACLFLNKSSVGNWLKTTQKGAQRCQKQLLTHLGIFYCSVYLVLKF